MVPYLVLTYQKCNDAHDQEAALNIQTVLAHQSRHCFRDTNGTLSDDDQSQQAHALHQVCLLETQHSPHRRYCYNGRGLYHHHNVPHNVYAAM